MDKVVIEPRTLDRAARAVGHGTSQRMQIVLETWAGVGSRSRARMADLRT